MTDYDSVDFFSDQSLLEDPYPYFDHLRSQCPVLSTAHHGVVAVSGYEEALEVYLDSEKFSSCNSVIGPFATFPVPLEGDDVGEIIDRYRDQLPMNEHMVTMDAPMHTRERALIMRLLTPKRLKENEAFMWRQADRQIDEFIGAGRCEFIGAYGQPFAMLVVADVLGVPESDHHRFREGFGFDASPGEIGSEGGDVGLNALGWLDACFAEYIEDRRREPRDDVLTRLATGTYPDGSTPDVISIVRTATFLFAAGQETTARLLAIALKYLAEYPELQDELRAHSERIPDFIEEALRIESPVKADFRMARSATTVAGVDVAAGTPVMLLNGAANHDPRQFDAPAEFKLDRPNAKVHIAFGRGVHSCPGGPLARAEGRVSVERILDRIRDIRLSEEHHGPPTARHFDYEPTWVLRGLHKLHIEFPGGGEKVSPRVAVVTGAGSGIGLGIARRLAADGMAVALFDLDGDRVHEAAADLTGQGLTATASQVDVADRRALAGAYSSVRQAHGPITVVVTSAGIESFDAIVDITPEKWDRILAVNLTGTFTCMQLAVPDMIESGWGRIVTISSSSALSGAPKMAHYVASKGGVIGLTKAFARDLARYGITVNTIPPSLVDTPMARKSEAAGDVPSVETMGQMVPLGRAGTPEDIASACSFLCSDQASYITGQMIGVNGGMYI